MVFEKSIALRFCSVFLLSSILLLPLASLAQPRPDVSGSIELEDTKEVHNPYQDTQLQTIEFFKAADGQIAKLRAGEIAPSPALNENMINHLTGVYLYCVINYGVCPQILDAILEVDVINARINKATTCPNMSLFWKYWIKNDMENRHKYSIKTPFLQQTSEFTKNKRPYYLHCPVTMKSETEGADSDPAYFKNRYAEGSAKGNYFAKMARLLEEVKAKVPNVFRATGAMR